MKILEIIHGLNPGGAERLVVDLCNEMSKEHDVTLLLLKKMSVGSNSFYLNEVSNRVKIIELNFESGFHISYPIKVYKTIKKIDPEIVHLHCVLNYCLFALLLDGGNRKYFQTLHIDIERIKNKKDNKFAFSYFGKRSKLKVIAISKTNYAEFKEAFPYCECQFINNGRAQQKTTIKLEEVRKEINQYRSSNNTITLLNVARCDQQKNHKRLLLAVQNLIKEGYDISVVIIGNGFFDTPLGEYLRKMNISNIHFLGTRNNVVDYMNVCDAFCFSSDFEGMPITAIEAILNGKPILSTPVCGVIDVVENGENGLISKGFEVEDLMEIIKEYIKKKTVLDSKAKEQINNSPFLISNCARQYIDFFKK